jgi:archaellum biogenesis ATPase FlaH
MSEHKILAAIIADRSSFDRVDTHLTPDDVTPEGAIILRAIRQFYKKDMKANRADIALIRNKVNRGLTNPKHQELFDLTFQRIKDTDVSAVNVIDDVLSAKRQSTEMALAEAIHAKDRGRIDQLLDKLSTLSMDEDLQGAVHEEYQGLDAEGLIDAFDKDHLIRVAPKSLNKRLKGGVLRGHHLVIVAYPETGKTALVLTMMNGFVQQGLKVLYVGNEDPTKAIVRRFISCVTGLGEELIRNDPEGAVLNAKAKGYDNAVFVGLSGGSLEDIRGLCTKHRPDVLVVDQIRNLSAQAENRTNQLETVARGMRNLAREFDVVAVSVTQGADSSRGKLVLDMGDVDGSNVGIPGAADVMLMIGMNDDYDMQDRRMLTLSKNKVGGNHSHWPVGIRREQSRFIDYAEELK